MLGVLRFIEVDAYGVQTGRQLLIKSGASMPPASRDRGWDGDFSFSVADELLKSSDFKQVLDAVQKNGFEIVDRTKSSD